MRPMIRFDGREIFLASSRTVSFGGRDLWSSVRETVFDIWSPPMNLGATINTSANELTPYLSGDGLSLYFGSDRIVAGQSGLVDLYVTHRTARTAGQVILSARIVRSRTIPTPIRGRTRCSPRSRPTPGRWRSRAALGMARPGRCAWSRSRGTPRRPHGCSTTTRTRARSDRTRDRRTAGGSPCSAGPPTTTGVGVVLSPPSRAIEQVVGGHTSPDWSADGRLLSYIVSGRGIGIRAMDTGEDAGAEAGPHRDEQPAPVAGRPITGRHRDRSRKRPARHLPRGRPTRRSDAPRRESARRLSLPPFVDARRPESRIRGS
jgi:hypothetical protein